jgi:hypothetical protein
MKTGKSYINIAGIPFFVQIQIDSSDRLERITGKKI